MHDVLVLDVRNRLDAQHSIDSGAVGHIHEPCCHCLHLLGCLWIPDWNCFHRGGSVCCYHGMQGRHNAHQGWGEDQGLAVVFVVPDIKHRFGAM